MDIKKADPTQRLREASQESEQTTQPKLYPKGFSEVPDSLEQVKQSGAFEQAIADNQALTPVRVGDAVAGLRIGQDVDSLLDAFEDALDRIPTFGRNEDVAQSVLNVLHELQQSSDSDSTPTTSVRSERFEKLKDVKIHQNERSEQAHSNNPLEGHVAERIFNGGQDEPLNPVQAGDALAGFRIGQDVDSLLDAFEDVFDRIPPRPNADVAQSVLAVLHALQQSSDSDQANGKDSTPTTSVRSEQINRIRATLTRILIGGDQK